MFFKLWKLLLARDSFSTEQNRQLERLSLKTIWNLLQVGKDKCFFSLLDPDTDP
jgi:hypothetical protein